VEAAASTVANVVLLKATLVNAKADREAKVKVKAKTNNAKNPVPLVIAGVEPFSKTVFPLKNVIRLAPLTLSWFRERLTTSFSNKQDKLS
jgi:hypothetical protein